jgi:hypothetical protein
MTPEWERRFEIYDELFFRPVVEALERTDLTAEEEAAMLAWLIADAARGIAFREQISVTEVVEGVLESERSREREFVHSAQTTIGTL